MLAKLGTTGWTAKSFSVFRVALGLYVAGHFAALLPWAAEIFSSEGMVATAGDSPIFGLLPSVLGLSDSPTAVTVWMGVAALSGFAIAANRYPRVAAVLAWYLGACFLGRNPLILNPALPHVGWVLLWFAAIPSQSGDKPWKLPPELYSAGWLLMGFGMTWSAITKLGSTSWMDGSALHYVWTNPLARDTSLRLWLLELPMEWVQLLTWGTLALELMALPVAFAPRLRPYVWTGLLLMHLGLLATVNFGDLSFGMLVVHTALFDPRWLAGWALRMTQLKGLAPVSIPKA